MERKIDELGRLVIPMEFRRALGWTTGTRVKMELQGGCINLTKNESRCSFCGSVHELKDVRGVRVCDCCIIDIKYGEFQEAY